MICLKNFILEEFYMNLSPRRVGIIGVGHVGAHCAFSLATQGIVDELVLVDTNRQKAISECQDLQDSVAYLPHRVRISIGQPEDLAGCDLAVISVGTITPDENRLSELFTSAKIVREVVPRAVRAGFDGIFINITNPCDIIAREVWKLSGFPKNRVLGTGTALDTARFRAVLARETGIDHKSVTAFMIGEHGASQLCLWSNVTVNGKPLAELEREFPGQFGHLDRAAIQQEVIDAGWLTYTGKHATEYGIASALARIVHIILRDERQMMPVSTLLEGQYGRSGFFIGTPAILGANGVEQVLEMRLSPEENAAFQRSCDIVEENIQKLEKVL